MLRKQSSSCLGLVVDGDLLGRDLKNLLGDENISYLNCGGDYMGKTIKLIKYYINYNRIK